MDEWHDFFLAEVGATAALSGFVIVSISINLTRILSYKRLPARAAESLIMLVGALVLSSITLIPQPPHAFAIEVAALSALLWLYPTRAQIRDWREPSDDPKSWLWTRVVSSQICLIPVVVAGVLLVAGELAAGLYWLAAAIVMSLVVGMLNTWVLLVEILR